MKHELATTAVQFADIFRNAPDIHAFDPKDSQGNTLFDSGKHIIPGAVIGVGISMYADSVVRRIPEFSNKCAAAGSFILASLYESYDACGESIPNATGIAQTCEEGFLDGATAQHATIDSLLDVLTTTGFSFIGALVATKIAYEARKKYINHEFYRMKQKELDKRIILDLAPSKEDMKIITIVED